MIFIKSDSVLKFPLLNIYHDGLEDIYRLFDKYTILKIEHNRDFWNEWE